MIACSIGIMVPQKIVADVNISTSAGTVTVTADNAGDLAAYLNTASPAQLDELKAATIVFVGKFNSTDLSKLNEKGCCVATTVNMGQAQFMKSFSSPSGNYKLYKTVEDRDNASTPNEGDICVVNGQLWKKDQYTTVVSWVAVSADEYESASNKQDVTGWFNNGNKESYEGNVDNGKFYKVPDPVDNALFYYYRVEKTSTMGWSQQTYNNGDSKYNPTLFADTDEMNADNTASDHSEAVVGGTVYVYNSGNWDPVSTSGEEEYDYSQMDFSYWKNTLEKATTSAYVPGNFVITQSAFSGCTQIREVVFNSGIIGEKVIANNGGDIPYFNKVTIGSGITEIQNQAFNKYPITDLDWSNATSLEVIGKEAFEDCPFTNVSTLTIPSSVKTIKEKAFFNICKPLTQAEVNAGKGVKTIIFPADTHLDEGEGIEDHAFWLESTDANPLKDVYVNANREIPCHKEAFSHWNTDGQTQVTQTGARTRLHYPTAFFDFYVGDYKSDINGGFLVGNPEMIKSRDSQYRINGWQKFISSGILMAPDVTWRSFSDDVPYYVPDVNEKGWRTEVYLVDGYDSSKGAKLVRMKIGDLIPANTGVIVHFEFNSTDGAVLYLPAALKEVTVDGETMKIIDPEKAAVNPYDVEVYSDHLYTPKGKTDSYKNYLKKLNKEPVYIDNVEIENGKKTYRNFFFCNNDDLKETDNEKWRGTEWSEACLQGWGFLRAVHGTYTVSNKAYLHFPATEGFPGAESVGIQEDHGTDTNAAALAKQFGFTTFNEDGEEFNCMPEDLGITTDIKQVENVGHNNIFYNLQGLKVENPSKGIYIRNGKKYVIK